MSGHDWGCPTGHPLSPRWSAALLHCPICAHPQVVSSPEVDGMSAARLREATSSMRSSQEQCSPGYEDRFYLAVADWLESQARAFDAYMDRQADPERRFNSLWMDRARQEHAQALAVANAYLGDPS